MGTLDIYRKWSSDRVEYELEKTPLPLPSTLPKSIHIMHHQKIGFLAGIRNPKMIFRFQMGLGKSLVSLLVLNYLIENKHANKALILAPKPLNISAWLTEASKFSKIPVGGYSGDSKERQQYLMNSIHSKEKIIVSDYHTLQSVFSIPNINPKLKKTGKVDARKHIANIEKIEQFSKHFDIIVCDEIHKNKNQKALRSTIVSHLMELIPYRYGLTGTLFDKSPDDIWSQFQIIDRGKTLGSWWYFMKTFFVEKFDPFTYNKKKWVFNDKMETALREKIGQLCLSRDTKECVDLPPINITPVSLPMPKEHASYYKTVEQDIIKSSGNLAACEDSFIKMRFLLSSLIPFRNFDADEKREYVRLPENPKLEWVMEFLDDIEESTQVIIFHDFVESGNWISEELKKNKISFSRIYGGTKDKEGEKDKFISGKTRVLLGNTNSIAEGFNLQNASYSIFYESPMSSIIRSQALQRSGGRIGQTKVHFIYDLFLSPSMEQDVIERVREGISLHKALTSTRRPV